MKKVFELSIADFRDLSFLSMNSFKNAEYQLCCPKEYYKKFISTGVRPDNRTFLESRNMKIGSEELPSCAGSSMVRIGDTLVLCGIKPELVLVGDCKDMDKFIKINFDYSPLICSETFESLEQSQIVTQSLQEIWDMHPLVSDENLIINDKIRWVLFIDLVCIIRDGAEMKSAYFAILSAFQSLQLPVVEIQEDVFVHEATHKIPFIDHGYDLYTFSHFEKYFCF
ncbi:Exosome complex component RRP43 [Thelohanellus kitauei]|uniref:Ribosomal RNA-processing protein 43 n=1 Tax=Thelohanellus kitauei TaxID=669202 RepID=A0A0C2N1H1_THEKT|nr:Exosome complex component RRP43 [Thelohanellus kitauei]